MNDPEGVVFHDHALHGGPIAWVAGQDDGVFSTFSVDLHEINLAAGSLDRLGEGGALDLDGL